MPLVRIDVQEGRTPDELRKLADAIQDVGVPGEDLIISVMANRHVDWSFGLGRAQFLDGTLSSLDRVSK